MYLYLLKYDILLFSFLLGSNLAFLFSLPFGHVIHSENSVDISLQVVIDHDVSYRSNHKGPDTNAFRKKAFWRRIFLSVPDISAMVISDPDGFDSYISVLDMS